MDDRHQEMVIKLLYHLSYDNDVIAQFAYTECVSLVSSSPEGETPPPQILMCNIDYRHVNPDCRQ